MTPSPRVFLLSTALLGFVNAQGESGFANWFIGRKKKSDDAEPVYFLDATMGGGGKQGKKDDVDVVFLNEDIADLDGIEMEDLEAEGGRIISGQAVQPGDLPFFGHFEGDIMCGGALVHEDIFITAAHCLAKGFPAKIRIGATQTVSQTEGESVPVCSGIIHPANNMKSMENDIAVLKLCDSVFINSYGDYNRNHWYPSATGVDLFMVGFGRTSIDSSLSPILQMAKVDYLDNSACNARYDKYNGDQTFCADSPTSAICYGDSGSPIMDSSNLIVGLNSYIVDTCNSAYPDFFTRVSSYADWLDEMICTQAMTTPEWCANPVDTDDGPGGTGGGGGGGPAQGDDDDAGGGGGGADGLTECLTLIIGFFQSFLGGR